MSRTLFRDFLFLAMFVFVIMVVWMLPFLNPVATDDDVEPPGNLIAYITWPEGATDVDLWVHGPGEPNPVGYSNKGGVLWNLLRDDLGMRPDATPINFENSYTRGILPGHYIINVHCYTCPVVPVKVHVELTIKVTDDKIEPLASTVVELQRNKEELTAIRFDLTSDGKIVPGSMNHVYQSLRTWAPGEWSEGDQR